MCGCPGSGKGTFSQIAHEHGYSHIGAGDLLRKEIQLQTALGQAIEEEVRQGKYINPDLMFELIKVNVQRSLEKSNKLIIDGYIRSEDSANRIFSYLNELGYEKNIVVVWLDSPNEICQERMNGRMTCENCDYVTNLNMFDAQQKCPSCDLGDLKKRMNDTEEVIIKRISQYREIIEPTYSKCFSNKFLKKIDTNKPLGELESEYQYFFKILQDL